MTLIDRLRAAWHALMGTTAHTAPAPTVVEHVENTRGISLAAQWEARRTGRAAASASQTFETYRPMPGVVPEGSAIAMDNALPTVQNMAQWAMQGAFNEGLAFLGFPYLAELAQRAEYRHATEIWAEHATRKFVKITGDDKKVAELHKALADMGVADAFEALSNHDGNFGRAHLFLDFGDADRELETITPLTIDPRKISPRRPLKRVTVVEPMWVYPAEIETRNPLSPTFYQPQSWYVYGRRVHSSRLLTLIGREVPNMLKPSYAFGGLSLTQMMKPYVDNWLRTRQSTSDMVHSYSTMVLATDMEQVLSGGDGAEVFTRVDMFNQMRDNRGTMVVDKVGEELTNVAVPMSGLDKLQAQAQEQMASVARIPLSVYLQITPTGLNASSEGENRSFYADVNGYKEKKYRPLLKPLLDVIMLSIWGAIDEGIGFEFEPLWEMSAKEQAEIRKLDSDVDKAYCDMGAVSNEEVRERLREDKAGLYHCVDLSGDAPEPDDDAEGGDPSLEDGASGQKLLKAA